MMTHERLLELVFYDPKTGLFYKRPNYDKSVGYKVNGYLQIKLDGKSYYSHRIAWFYINKVMPDKNIDHIDCNKSNNIYSNLRIADKSQNGQNRGMPFNNTSGYKGVVWHKQHKRWMAQIMDKGKYKYLGYYKTEKEAYEAYCAAAKSMHNTFHNLG